MGTSALCIFSKRQYKNFPTFDRDSINVIMLLLKIKDIFNMKGFGFSKT
jgi:hypothetical protein